MRVKQIAYHNINVFVQVLAGGEECLTGGELEVPHLVLHTAVELLRVFLALQMKLNGNRRVLSS